VSEKERKKTGFLWANHDWDIVLSRIATRHKAKCHMIKQESLILKGNVEALGMAATLVPGPSLKPVSKLTKLCML